ncbi:MAG: hypothetical protein RDU25_05830 [Patescibacteria group bacterium]|nr:hypothetical protein [Patescibacteria group bacterium]
MRDELLQKLQEELPPDCFDIREEGLATYYDHLGVSFGENAEEQAVINQYIVRMIAEKAGSPITVVQEHHAGNGHFSVTFVRNKTATGG